MNVKEGNFRMERRSASKSDIANSPPDDKGDVTPAPKVFKEPSSRARLISSYVATIVGVTVTSPIDVLKTRLQVQMDKPHLKEAYNKIPQAFAKMWRQEGIQGMFKGYRATVICTPIFHSFYFPTYEKLRLYFAEQFNEDKASLKVVFPS